MLFYTPEFAIFFASLLCVLSVVRANDRRKRILLVASYVFYMWWNPAFILLIVFATGVNYLVSQAIQRRDDERVRRQLLIVGLVTSLGLLAFFKYTNFLEENALWLLRWLGFDVDWTVSHIVLPVGISFYTFQTLSYTIDVYRRRIEPCSSSVDFALFVAFFPQLVAGPIVRAAEFLPQLQFRRAIACDQATFFLICRGLAKKVLVADNVAPLADTIFSSPGAYPSLVIWLGAACFAVQIYCDFSGYSDIAIGISRILGYRIPINFAHPYMARNPSDFWRRWHISLSSWLRDYLYIPLGGNRHGAAHTYRNLMVTMLLGGLWHGASWNFVLWGFIHGAILVVHRGYSELRRRYDASWRPSEHVATRLVSIIAMQYFTLLAWISFRVTDVAALRQALERFVIVDLDFRVTSIGLGAALPFGTVLLLLAFALLHVASYSVGHLDRYLGRISLPRACVVCFLLGMAACVLWPLADQPFIYFQF